MNSLDNEYLSMKEFKELMNDLRNDVLKKQNKK
jgi:hypothetical protein